MQRYRPAVWMMVFGLLFAAATGLAQSPAPAANQGTPMASDSHSAPSAPDTPAPLNNGVTAPRVITAPSARIPLSAKQRGVTSAVVIVELTVDKDGMPQDAHVTQSGGYDLDESALEAVKKYRFQPAMKDGQPVAVHLTIQIKIMIY